MFLVPPTDLPNPVPFPLLYIRSSILTPVCTQNTFPPPSPPHVSPKRSFTQLPSSHQKKKTTRHCTSPSPQHEDTFQQPEPLSSHACSDALSPTTESDLHNIERSILVVFSPPFSSSHCYSFCEQKCTANAALQHNTFIDPKAKEQSKRTVN